MHIISGQLLGILFPVFSYSHSIVELNVADDLDALERVQRRLLAGGVRSSMRAFGLHDAHG